ncbi:MAG: DUF1254 domain-containing protein [Nitrospirota bacterium]
MKTVLKHIWLSFLAGTLAFAMNASAVAAPTPDEARAIAKEAFIYAYAPVQGYKTLYNQTQNAHDPGYIGGFGRYRHYTRVATPADRDIVTPNNDTPYSWAWLDLRREPYVLKLPAVPKDRYNVFQWFDLYTHNFAYAGVRATGYEAGNYLFIGPNWKGDVPPGITKVFRSETDIVGTLTRTSIDGEADVPNVCALQQQYVLMPLSEFAGQKPPAPVPAVKFPKWDEKQALSAGFIGYLNFLLQFCQPIHPNEAALMKRFAKIGIGAGKAFEPAKLDPGLLAAIEQGAQEGLKETQAFAALQTSSRDIIGTREHLGDNMYLKRNAAALVGIYGNSVEEAYYNAYQLDADGKPLTAQKDRYVLRFAPGELPPVKFFWSFTMYSLPERNLAANPINRYSIGSRSPGLKPDADGGLTIYVQAQSPGVDKESNWLPAPAGPFFIISRYYGPEPRMISGEWAIPALKRVE